MPLRTSAKTHTHSPTPLIKGRNPDPDHPDVYHFQLERIRRGGTVHVVFAATSPTAPGRSIPVRNGKVGFLPMIEAAKALIAISHWDPTTHKDYAKPRWNKDAARYGERYELAEIVVCQLDRLLNPRRGRPTNVDSYRRTRALADRMGVMLSAPTAIARQNRRSEIVQMASRMRAALQAVLERWSPDRSVVTGFTRAETDVVKDLLRTVELSITELVIKVETNNLIGEVQTQPVRGNPFIDRANMQASHDVDGGFRRRVAPVSGGIDISDVEAEIEAMVNAPKPPQKPIPLIAPIDRNAELAEVARKFYEREEAQKAHALAIEEYFANGGK